MPDNPERNVFDTDLVGMYGGYLFVPFGDKTYRYTTGTAPAANEREPGDAVLNCTEKGGTDEAEIENAVSSGFVMMIPTYETWIPFEEVYQEDRDAPAQLQRD